MRNFSKSKRIVIKIGTNILTKGDSIDVSYVQRIAGQVNDLLQAKRQVLIVSSGAIGMGTGLLTPGKHAQSTVMRQAYAAIGQPLLMTQYRKAFLRYDRIIAQVLLTTEVFNNRKSYLNLKNSIETLLKLGVVPIINENDSISTEEIGSAFGDNDKLSALVASKIDADLLIILSDIECLYDKDPRKYKNAKAIPVVYEVTDHILRMAGGSGGRHGTGGMKTKLQAAKIASNVGCRIVLANGRIKDVLSKIIQGAEIGTLFLPVRKLNNRKRWILNSKESGTINIDPGAVIAIKKKKSLLPSGITSVKGSFKTGDIVMLNDQAKAITNFSSSQLRVVAGKHSDEITRLLGPNHKDEVATPENIVFLGY